MNGCSLKVRSRFSSVTARKGRNGSRDIPRQYPGEWFVVALISALRSCEHQAVTQQSWGWGDDAEPCSHTGSLMVLGSASMSAVDLPAFHDSAPRPSGFAHMRKSAPWLGGPASGRIVSFPGRRGQHETSALPNGGPCQIGGSVFLSPMEAMGTWRHGLDWPEGSLFMSKFCCPDDQITRFNCHYLVKTRLVLLVFFSLQGTVGPF